MFQSGYNVDRPLVSPSSRLYDAYSHKVTDFCRPKAVALRSNQCGHLLIIRRLWVNVGELRASHSREESCLSFLTELRRRNVFRVAATYVVASWVIIQVVTAVSEPLGFPDWFEAGIIILLVIGFPIAILLAWAFELTPDGIRATPSEEISAAPEWRILDTALVIGLVAVAVAVVWARVSPDMDGAGSSTISSADMSVAVLPFVDMSPTGDQAYFGDGIAEELINELTRLEGLRVASRSSSFAYRDKAMDLRSIGEALNVTTVLEGSVRKDGDHIRVTAQLINSADGYHLWSETFDRELEDIFAIQGEIASAVGGALGVRLGVGTVNAFLGAGTTSVEAYETYLRGLSTPIFASAAERMRLFERAVELDQEYAVAWAALGLTVGSTMWISPVEEAPQILDRAIPILNKAVELEPDSAYSYTLLATVNYATFDWTSSEQLYSKAMEIESDGQVLGHYANMLMRSGRSSESLRYGQLAASASRYAWGTAIRFNAALALGQFEKVRESGVWVIGSAPELTDLWLALNAGDSEALSDALAALPPNHLVAAKLFRPVLGEIDSPERALMTLRSVYADTDAVWPAKHHDVALLAAFLGDPEFALEAIGHEARLTTLRFGALWYPVMGEVRKLRGFKQLVTDVNLVEYWRNFGWSDHCRPIGTEDFECF